MRHREHGLRGFNRARARKRATSHEVVVAGNGLERTDTAKLELQKVIGPLTEIATELRTRHDDHLRNPLTVNQADPFTPAQIAGGLDIIAEALQQKIAAQYDANPFTLEQTADELDIIAELLQQDPSSEALNKVKKGESDRELIIKIENVDEKVVTALGKIKDKTKPAPGIRLPNFMQEDVGFVIPTLAEGLYIGVFTVGIVACFAARPEDMQNGSIIWEQKQPIFPIQNALEK